MEEVFRLVFEIIFAWPGAFVRWLLFYRGKKTYKEVFLDDGFRNLSIGIMVISCLGGLLYAVVSRLK